MACRSVIAALRIIVFAWRFSIDGALGMSDDCGLIFSIGLDVTIIIVCMLEKIREND